GGAGGRGRSEGQEPPGTAAGGGDAAGSARAGQGGGPVSGGAPEGGGRARGFGGGPCPLAAGAGCPRRAARLGGGRPPGHRPHRPVGGANDRRTVTRSFAVRGGRFVIGREQTADCQSAATSREDSCRRPA